MGCYFASAGAAIPACNTAKHATETLMLLCACPSCHSLQKITHSRQWFPPAQQITWLTSQEKRIRCKAAWTPSPYFLHTLRHTYLVHLKFAHDVIKTSKKLVKECKHLHMGSKCIAQQVGGTASWWHSQRSFGGMLKLVCLLLLWIHQMCTWYGSSFLLRHVNDSVSANRMDALLCENATKRLGGRGWS